MNKSEEIQDTIVDIDNNEYMCIKFCSAEKVGKPPLKPGQIFTASLKPSGKSYEAINKQTGIAYSICSCCFPKLFQKISLS